VSNSVAGGSLVHYNDQHIQVRKDLFDLCAYDKADFNQGLSKNGTKVKDEPNQACMAMILRLLETLTNRNNETWITLAYSTIVTLLYNTYGESTVRNSIAALIQRDYIKRSQKNKASVPSYALNIPVIQSALDQQRKEYIQKGVESNSQGVESNSQGVESNSLRVSNSTPYKKEDNKITHKIINERKNGDVSAKQETSHSSIHASSSSFQNSSQETKPKEVTLTEEEQAIYEFGVQTLFKAKPPLKTAKLKGECAEIAEHVKTLEQFQSLLQFVRALPYIQGQVHLKNLVNALNGWLVSQQPAPSTSSQKPTYEPYVIDQKRNEERKAALLASVLNQVC